MPIYFNDHEPYVAEWLRNLFPDQTVTVTSVTDLTADDVHGHDRVHLFAGIGGWEHALQLAGWPDDRPVWTGSCPCQPFSVAGKQKGTNDARHLWPEMRRLIAECKPRGVFGEQVASNDGRAWLAGVRADLEALGYRVGAADLCAAGVGAPHIRQRLYWVADLPERNADRLADTEHTGRDRAEASAAIKSGDGEDGRLHHRSAGGMEQSTGDRRIERRAEPGRRGTEPRCGADFWDAYDLIPCGDGKARRVESGTCPLAHGSAFTLGSGSPFEGKSRVGMLRAYGNAIVPQVAAEFIRSYMEVRGDNMDTFT